MVKKSQTTGLPKTKRKADAPENAPKGKSPDYRSRAEREAEIQRRIVMGAIIVTTIIVALIAFAFIIDRVIIPSQAVASANGQNITVDEFQRRVRIERALINEQLNRIINLFVDFNQAQDVINNQINQILQTEPYSTWYSETTLPDQLGLRVLNDIINDRLIRAKAAEFGISVTAEDIDHEVREYIGSLLGYDPASLERIRAAGDPEATPEATATAEPTATNTPTPFVSPTPSPTPTITPTPEVTPTETNTPLPTVPPAATLTNAELKSEFDTVTERFYATIQRDAGVGRDDIRAFFESVAFRRKLRDQLTPEITLMSPFADSRHILVDTQEQALDVLDALNNGESFAELARVVSKDGDPQTGSGSAGRGGELGWTPVWQFVTPFREALLSAAIGEFVGPVQSEFGYHIIQVRGREDREITESQRDSFKERAFQEWLETYRDSEEAQFETYSTWTDYVPTEPIFQLIPEPET